MLVISTSQFLLKMPKMFFCTKYNSIISAKLIVNHENGNSKGYAFFEFTNYKEFSDALKLKGINFGKIKVSIKFS